VANQAEATGPRKHPYGGFVVTPGWDDRRNFVEACLCDAAIAIEAITEGTASETLFCVYLGRPAVVVGTRSSGAVVTPEELRGYVGQRVRSMGDRSAIDIGITGALDWAASAPDRVATQPLPADSTAAKAVVAELLGPPPLGRLQRKSGPRLRELVDDDSWDHYVKEAMKAAGRWPG
jgi:hypothetical protein